MVRTISFGEATIIGHYNHVAVTTPDAKSKFQARYGEVATPGGLNEYRGHGCTEIVPAWLDEKAGSETDDWKEEADARRSMWAAVERCGGIVDVTPTYLTDIEQGRVADDARGMRRIASIWGQAPGEFGIQIPNGYVVFDMNDAWECIVEVIR